MHFVDILPGTLWKSLGIHKNAQKITRLSIKHHKLYEIIIWQPVSIKKTPSQILF